MIVAVNTLMGLPPVVAGLLVYLMLSSAGPLGVLQLLYTPTAMIIAQSVLVTPIVAALTRQVVADLHDEYREQLRSLGLGLWDVVGTLLWDARYSLLTVALAGFGRAIAEVGAVIIVGGNINHVTRVMTTTIALETSKGNLALALALGMVLIALGAGDQRRRHGGARHGDAGGLCLSARSSTTDLAAAVDSRANSAGPRARPGVRGRRAAPDRRSQSHPPALRAHGGHGAERRRQEPDAEAAARAAAAFRRRDPVGRTARRRCGPAAPGDGLSAPRPAAALGRRQPHPCAALARRAAPSTAGAGRAGRWLRRVSRALARTPARLLSGGEQQRLAMARALSLEPEVLFLDEPTANLDPASTLAIERLIQRAHDAGTKIVLVTHDVGQARRLADEVVFLHRGRVEEQSPIARFLDAPASAAARAFLDGQLVL